MQTKNSIKKAVFAVISCALTPMLATAQDAVEAPEAVQGLVDNIKATAWYIGDGLIVIGIIWVGVMFLTAGGSDEKLSKAKKGLIWVIVGTVILLGFNTLVSVISDIANI